MALAYRIFDDNYAQSKQYGVAATSEQSDFPASNIKEFLRSATWRSGGYYEIDSSNNKINFKDSVMGSELTATIPVGNYEREDLLTEMKTQLDVVGSDTYTVSYASSTGLFTIASDGSYLDLLFNSGSDSANTIADAIGFDSSSDYTGATSYTGSTIAIHTVERLIIDLKSFVEPVDAFVALFEPEGYRLSDKATVRLKANNANSWTSPSVDQLLTLDTNTLSYHHYFSSDQTYRYWAIEITDPTNSNLFVELSTILLSNVTTIQGPEIGFTYNLEDLSGSESTDFGQEYYDIYPNRKGFAFDFSLLDESDRETLVNIYQKIGVSRPIGITLDADEQVFDKESFFIYGRLRGTQSFEHRFQEYFDSSFSIEEAF